jgi:hypothetical protein
MISRSNANFDGGKIVPQVPVVCEAPGFRSFGDRFFENHPDATGLPPSFPQAGRALSLRAGSERLSISRFAKRGRILQKSKSSARRRESARMAAIDDVRAGEPLR